MKQERTLAERVGLRWPNMAQRTNRWVPRLSPGSRVRSAMLRRAARIGFEAWNRGDLALVAYLDDLEVETHPAQESGVALGLDPVYYGPEGHSRAMELWNEAWRMGGRHRRRCRSRARSDPRHRPGPLRGSGQRNQARRVGSRALHLPRRTDLARRRRLCSRPR